MERPPVFGYEHRYEFLVDDDISRRCESTPSIGVKSFLFEMRTNFIFRTIEGVEESMGSETLNASVKETDEMGLTMLRVFYERLAEYLFSVGWYGTFAHKAISFARQRAASNVNDVTPVIVRFEVRTVQLREESLDVARDRAIRPDRLVPKYVTSVEAAFERVRTAGMNGFFINYLRGLRPSPFNAMDDYHISDWRELENVDELVDELENDEVTLDYDELKLVQKCKLMNGCGICGRNPTVGALISVLKCKHAFHWHCAVNWLEGNETCPTCGAKDHYYLSGFPD